MNKGTLRGTGATTRGLDLAVGAPLNSGVGRATLDELRVGCYPSNAALFETGDAGVAVTVNPIPRNVSAFFPGDFGVLCAIGSGNFLVNGGVLWSAAIHSGPNAIYTGNSSALITTLEALPVISNQPGVALSLPGLDNLLSNGIYVGDGAAVTAGDALDFGANSTWATRNSGTLTVGTATSFSSAGTIEAGVTMTDRYHFHAADAVSGGTLTNQRGFASDFLVGATNNWPVSIGQGQTLTVTSALTAAMIAVGNGATVTLDVASGYLLGVLRDEGTYLFKQTANSLAMAQTVTNAAIYRNVSTAAVNLGPVLSFTAGYTYGPDTQTGIHGAFCYDFRSVPIFNAGPGGGNTGTMTSGLTHLSFVSTPTLGTGVTMTDRYGVQINNIAGSGTLSGTNYGIYIAALSKGATQWGIYNLSTTYLAGTTIDASGVVATLSDVNVGGELIVTGDTVVGGNLIVTGSFIGGSFSGQDFEASHEVDGVTLAERNAFKADDATLVNSTATTHFTGCEVNGGTHAINPSEIYAPAGFTSTMVGGTVSASSATGNLPNGTFLLYEIDANHAWYSTTYSAGVTHATSTLTTTGSHGLSPGDTIAVGACTISGLTAGSTYTVATTPTGTTLTLTGITLTGSTGTCTIGKLATANAHATGVSFTLTYSTGTAAVTTQRVVYDGAGLTAGTTNWGLALSTTNNYLAGSLRVGSTTAPTKTVDITGTLAVSGASTLTGGISGSLTITGATTITNTLTAGAALGTIVSLYQDGNAASTAGVTLSTFQWQGATDGSNTRYAAAAVRAVTAELFSGSAGGAGFEIRTTPVTTHTIATAAHFAADGGLHILPTTTTGRPTASAFAVKADGSVWIAPTAYTSNQPSAAPLVLSAAGAVTAASSILSSGATAGVGYATGAGGAITQITSKSTGVTLNKITGQITMSGAALGATTGVGFTFTNSTIAATDTVVVSIATGATANSYTIIVDAVASGSCHIFLRNITVGSLSEALVLNFAVLKAVAA